MLAKQPYDVNPTHPCTINYATHSKTIALPGPGIEPAKPRQWRIIDLERTPTGYRVIGGEDEAKVICAACDAHISGPQQREARSARVSATSARRRTIGRSARSEWEQGQSPHPDGDWMLAGLH